jgi:hypothetical protein
MKYEKKKLQRKVKEMVITVIPEAVPPVERGANLSPESGDRRIIDYFRTSRRDWSCESVR